MTIRTAIALGFVVTTLALSSAEATTASADVDAATIAARIAARPANEGRVGTMDFVLRNKQGRERRRSAALIHARHDDATRIAITFQRPASIRGTAFLSHDYAASTDQNWLYVPAAERVRRLPASDGSDYFMGTDLTYGDIKNDFKFPLDEWQFTAAEPVRHDGQDVYRLTGVASSARTVRDSGYSSFDALVDTRTWFPVEINYRDADGEPLKTMRITDQQKVGDAWTAMRFVVRNLQSGHETTVQLRDMRHVPDLDLDRLAPEALADGIRGR